MRRLGRGWSECLSLVIATNEEGINTAKIRATYVSCEMIHEIENRMADLHTRGR